MERIPPLARSDNPQLEEFYKVWDTRLGYLPNTILTMSRKPGIVTAFARLSEAVHNDCSLPPQVRGLVGFMSSHTASCNYCMAHTATAAVRYGIPEAFVLNLMDFDTDPIYSDQLRAALRFSRAVSSQPSTINDEILRDVRKHFSDTQVIEIIAICSFYGWLNRMNSGLQMELEDEPRSFSEEKLAPSGNWELGRHGHANEYKKA
jgi:uncharacterized peroxidase-related enzyme